MAIKYFDIRVNMFLCWAQVQLHLTNLDPKLETTIKIKWKDDIYMDYLLQKLSNLFNFFA